MAIAKEFIRGACAFHYNVILLGIVEALRVLGREVLDAEVEPVLKRCADVVVRRLNKKGVWVYGERLV